MRMKYQGLGGYARANEYSIVRNSVTTYQSRMYCSHFVRIAATPSRRIAFPFFDILPSFSHLTVSIRSNVFIMRAFGSIFLTFSSAPTAPQMNKPEKHEENRGRYVPGGYHPVYLSEMFIKRHQVVKSLVTVSTLRYGLQKIIYRCFLGKLSVLNMLI